MEYYNELNYLIQQNPDININELIQNDIKIKKRILKHLIYASILYGTGHYGYQFAKNLYMSKL